MSNKTENGQWEETKVFLLLLFPFAAASIPFFLPSTALLSTKVAAAGAILAAAGVFVIARPVWRIGIFEYISLKTFETLRPSLNDPEAEARYNKMLDPKEAASDAIYQQVFGPIYVGIGTILNGIGGFF